VEQLQKLIQTEIAKHPETPELLEIKPEEIDELIARWESAKPQMVESLKQSGTLRMQAEYRLTRKESQILNDSTLGAYSLAEKEHLLM